MKRLVLEYWLPLAVWLALIFYFSTDRFSSNETSGIIASVLTFFFPSLSPGEIDFLHGVIRKFAHISEYFILTLFTHRSLSFEAPDLARAKVRTMMFVVLAALFDELHQGFTVSRGASVVDVGYDGVGAVWALWLIVIYENRRVRSHSVL